MIKVVVLDGRVINPGDVQWQLDLPNVNVEIYEATPNNQILKRSQDADYLIINKVVLGEEHLQQLPQLKAILLTATGYNNIDIKTARKHGVDVCNVVGYGSTAVAQHVFALILKITNEVALHARSVAQGEWTKKDVWCYWLSEVTELSGKTLGIYGYGVIGREVAKIGLAFGMRVIAYRRSDGPSDLIGVKMVDFDQLIAESDFLSLHAPLSAANQGVINRDVFSKMKSTAILINTGRGGLINEADLANALKEEAIAGAALDVLSEEPPSQGHPLIGLPRCIISPHMAWVARESRQRLLDMVGRNLKAHINGHPINVVN